MAEPLRNFFDTSPLSPLPSSSLPPPLDDSPALELSLSLSLSAPQPSSTTVSPPPPSRHLPPRKQRSDSFVLTAMPPPFDSTSQESVPFLPPLPSRDQIWHNLQRNSSALSRDPATPPSCSSTSGTSARMEMEDLWNRRSASVQVVMPFRRDVLQGTPVRSRSCNHGILQQLPPNSRRCLLTDHQAARAESDLLMRNNAAPSTMESHPQNDMAELQKRREIQAQRRLQARKRRRSLMEEKQLKKGARSENSNGSQRLKPSVSADEKFLMQTSLEGRHDARQPDSVRYGNRSQKLVSSSSAVHEFEPGTEKVSSDSSRHGPEKASSGSGRNECGTETRPPSDSIPREYGGTGAVPSDSHRLECGAETRVSSDSSRNDQGTQRRELQAPMETSADAEGLDSKSQCDDGPTETTSSDHHDASAPDQSGSQTHVADSRIGITTPSVFSSVPDRTSSSNMAYPIQYLPLRKASSVQPTSQRCSSRISSEGWRPPSSPCSASNNVCTDQGQGEGRGENPALRRPTSNNNIKTTLAEAESEAQIISSAQCSTVNLKASAFCKFGGSNNEDCMKSVPVERQQSWPAASLPHAKPVLSSNQCLSMRTSPYMGLTEAMKEGNTRSLQGCKSAESSRTAPVNPGVEIDRQKSGSFSDLPSVTTTGRGPHGRTISGVMYITSARKVQLICNCHGKHMSPVEFVAHSGSSDLSNPERSIVVTPFPFFNQVASTPV